MLAARYIISFMEQRYDSMQDFLGINQKAVRRVSCGGKTENKCCCCEKHKERSPKEYKDLLNRLKRIEGQVRGVEHMIEEDAYCTDVLVQVAAINAALNSFNKVLLGNHIRTCVAENIREGNDEVVDELVGVIQRLMK